MRVRHKVHGYTGIASQFNIHGLGEMIVYFDDDPVTGESNGMDSVFCRDYEVFLETTGKWKAMDQAFKDRDLINDNYNTRFFEPKTQEDRERGFTL